MTGLVQAGQHMLAAEYCSTFGLNPTQMGVLPSNVQAQLAREAETYLQLPLPPEAVVRCPAVWGLSWCVQADAAARGKGYLQHPLVRQATQSPALLLQRLATHRPCPSSALNAGCSLLTA